MKSRIHRPINRLTRLRVKDCIIDYGTKLLLLWPDLDVGEGLGQGLAGVLEEDDIVGPHPCTRHPILLDGRGDTGAAHLPERVMRGEARVRRRGNGET